MLGHKCRPQCVVFPLIIDSRKLGYGLMLFEIALQEHRISEASQECRESRLAYIADSEAATDVRRRPSTFDHQPSGPGHLIPGILTQGALAGPVSGATN